MWIGAPGYNLLSIILYVDVPRGATTVHCFSADFHGNFRSLKSNRLREIYNVLLDIRFYTGKVWGHLFSSTMEKNQCNNRI